MSENQAFNYGNGQTKIIAHLEEFLNLDSEHARVYAALLSVNGATLGQVAELSGYDVITVARILKDLKSRGLVKAFGGKFSWYVAATPFLQSIISLLDVSDLVHVQQMLDQLKQDLVDVLQREAPSILNHLVKDDSLTYLVQQQILNPLVMELTKRMEDQFENIEKAMERTLLKIRALRLDLNRLQELQNQFLDRKIIQRWTYPLIGEGAMLIALRDAVQASQQGVRDLLLFMPQPDLKSLKMLSTLPDRLTITVVTSNIARIPKSFLKPLAKKKIILRIRSDLDFWGLVRDAEIAIFCPVDEDGNVSGIITEDLRLVRILREEFLRESTRGKIINVA